MKFSTKVAAVTINYNNPMLKLKNNEFNDKIKVLYNNLLTLQMYQVN